MCVAVHFEHGICFPKLDFLINMRDVPTVIQILALYCSNMFGIISMEIDL